MTVGQPVGEDGARFVRCLAEKVPFKGLAVARTGKNGAPESWASTRRPTPCARASLPAVNCRARQQLRTGLSKTAKVQTIDAL